MQVNREVKLVQSVKIKRGWSEWRRYLWIIAEAVTKLD